MRLKRSSSAALALALLGAVPAAARARVDLYVMSLCPYGVQAENALLPAVQALGDAVELRVHFIGNENAVPAPGKTRFTALHGPPEVKENIRQVCALRQDPAKALDYILRRNKALSAFDWRTPAKEAGLDAAALQLCAEGEEGARLYSANLAIHRARQAFSSPTIDIDDVPFAGPRSTGSFLRALCAALGSKSAKPAACAKLPAEEPALAAAGDCGPAAAASAPPPPVAITVVTEKGCAACAPTLVDVLAGLHPGRAPRVVDHESREGRELIASHHAVSLPLYVLDAAVERAPGFKNLLAAYYERSADGYVVRPGPETYRPSVRLDRARAPRHVDLFVSGLSPESVSAQLEFARFLSANLDKIKDLTLSVRFVASFAAAPAAAPSGKDPGGAARAAPLAELATAPGEGRLVSPRGDAELAENARQACLFQHAPAADYFAYVACRGEDLSPARAASCLRPSEPVAACIKSDEGLELLRKDARLLRELDTRAETALLWENRYGPFRWNEVDWKGLLLGAPKLAKIERGGERAQ